MRGSWSAGRGSAQSRNGGNDGRIISIFIEIVVHPGQLRAYRYFHESRKSRKAARSARQPNAAPSISRAVRAGDVGLPVGRLQEKLRIAASTLSHHLHRLILTGLVTQERHATTLICRANYPAMNGLVGFLVDECCVDAGCSATKSEVAADDGSSCFAANFYSPGRIEYGRAGFGFSSGCCDRRRPGRV